MRITPNQSQHGFTLIETIVAAALIATAIASLAHVVALSTRQAAATRRSLEATVAAQTKLEQLRGLTWSYAPDGSRLSDQSTNLTVEPSTPDGGVGLTTSPPQSLVEDIDGYVDYLDDLGAVISDGNGGASAAYVRRWALSPLDPSDADTVVLEVCVFNRHDSSLTARAAACLSTVRTRKP